MKSVFRGLRAVTYTLERSLQEWEDHSNPYSVGELYQGWRQLLTEGYNPKQTKQFFDYLNNDWRSLYGTAPWNFSWIEQFSRAARKVSKDFQRGIKRAFTPLISGLKPLAIALGELPRED